MVRDLMRIRSLVPQALPLRAHIALLTLALLRGCKGHKVFTHARDPAITPWTARERPFHCLGVAVPLPSVAYRRTSVEERTTVDSL